MDPHRVGVTIDWMTSSSIQALRRPSHTPVSHPRELTSLRPADDLPLTEPFLLSLPSRAPLIPPFRHINADSLEPLHPKYILYAEPPSPRSP